MMQETIYINGNDVLNLGAEALKDYGVGGTKIENDFFLGRNRTHFSLLSAVHSTKPVWFQLSFFGATRHDVMQKKSRVDALLYGVCEVRLPDGFYYRCMLQNVGEIAWQGSDAFGVLGEVKYTLEGIQHDALVTVPGASFYCEGTMPQMDASLSVTVSRDAAAYALGGAIFQNVRAGEALTFDGINKRILRNGAPGAAGVQWINFPSVTPGENFFTAEDPVIVQYYPCYL